ncbi:MAG TPA: tetratricopeptide repeat protein [Bryobacteraceae bacterium]|jgi:tetratricopeptide (TPR) repeat protein|nr:tetratricopeptide repeat protein [Bryobacteraceae bacterium]
MRTKLAACLAGFLMVAGLATAQKKVSKKEYDAFMAIQNATTAQDRIKAVDNFVTSFADSQLKSTALYLAADAAQRMGDSAKAIAYGNDAIEADPKNFDAMLVVSGELARGTRENDLDKDEKLARATKLSNDALNIIQTAPKPNPNLPDDKWEAYKKDATAQAHSNLGLIAMVQKKYDVAANEFKTAVDNSATPDPSTMVRLATAYDEMGKYDDGIAELNKVLATPNLNPVVQKFATNEKARAEQLKAKNGK